MSQSFRIATVIVCVSAMSAAMHGATAAEVRLNGATTVVDRVVNPNRVEVEQQSGHKLVIIGNATGRGLADLVDGKCDASMSSEPLNIAVEAAAVAGKQVDASRLVFSVVQNDEIVFVVHKNNPVKKLSWAQIRDIHTGKISNWKQVGGKDAPIMVFSDAITGGTRAMIKHVILEGQEYGPDTKPQAAVKKVGEQVAITEEGFGGLGKGFVDSDKVSIVETKKFERPLGFITLGQPTGDVAKVIGAFRDAAKK